ncbi:Toxin RTX-I translocation ATP-binding protein [Pandoraea terrae]|uniref:Cyclolysin secretion/processing ATP-binding protein CyaB n=1 Tax=Pandoraea terrae TaxID=1537710 RepID=A0A5E4XCZ2_9BURK|nr:peptidase domain-containing ABC transporter [Pandoraea terrae]VVE34279.1 Toxin RTX-I translocation ATP-binding protein [Pandoraea terrae]
MPSILQTESAECGLACIAMVVSHFGHRVGLPEMRKRFSMSQKGGSFGDLIQVARRMHLASRAVKLDLTSLDKLKTPCILHWEFNHFVVLERVKAGLAHIHDPAHGFRKVSMEIVSRSFTGAALELWPTGEFRQGVEREAVSLSRLIGSLTGLRGTFAQLLTLSFSLEIFVLAAPFFIQWTLDHAVPSGDRDLMLLLAIGFLTLAMCQHVTAVMRSWLLMYLGASWNVRWCSNIFSHLIRLPVDYFIKRHLGDLISKFGAVDEIQRTVTTSFLEGTLDGVMTFLTLLLMFLYSPTLAAVVCLSAALYTLVRVLWFSPLRAAVQTHLIHASKQQTHFLETLRGIRAIKLFSREDERRSAWLSLLADQVNADICVQRLTLLYKHSNGLLSSLENILIVWLGAAFVIDGQLTIGALMAFIAYKMQFQTRVSSLIDKVADYRMLSVQADRLSDIALAKAEDIEDAPRSTEIITEVRVDVSNLGFRYGDFEPRILEGVSFTIHPGESVAITGPSGCGKSTLAHLLLGILTPTAGEIVLTGAQSKHMDAHALRRAFGTVMQDDMLLAGSLSENISFFAPDADMTWVVACAELACIHDEIQALPMRYDTLVGDMGSVLSGGQKQRILLARALYKKPACLLLDEATSHLDIACERQVNAAVRSLKMTRIIIAHRPETIASADRVLRLEHGKIVSS